MAELLHPGRWTLRSRIVLSTVTVFALVAVCLGAITVYAVRSYQMGRLDARLTAGAARFNPQTGQSQPGCAPGDRQDSPDVLCQPGQGVGSLAALIKNGTVVSAGYIEGPGKVDRLSSEQRAALENITSSDAVQTVQIPGIGAIRVVATQTGAGTAVTGISLDTVQRTTRQVVLTELVIVILGLIIAAVGASMLVERALRPLERVRETAARVSELPLDRGEVELGDRISRHDANPQTEIGQVGAAINRMLDHIGDALQSRHYSEQQVRRFVADASHELRTPLATIRGYAELTRPRRAELDADVAAALGQIEVGAQRMGRLVDDLLLLARLDSGREIELRNVDLTAVLIELVDDAHVAGSGYGWSIDVPDEPVEVRGDDLRLRQVFGNLLTNARVHTPEGTNITVGLHPAGDDGRVSVTVVDDGPGIPPDMIDTVFDRFSRGDTARSRSVGSTGLGLSIVDSVTCALGGSVSVQSEPGHTEFTVLLAPAATDTPDSPAA